MHSSFFATRWGGGGGGGWTGRWNSRYITTGDFKKSKDWPAIATCNEKCSDINH